jgi:hypothetical protein
MALTALDAKNAKAGERDYKLFDSLGLYLFVTQAGARSWRFKYRVGGKEKRLTFGQYPEITLAVAREQRDKARAVLREGRDPAVEAQVRPDRGVGHDLPERRRGLVRGRTAWLVCIPRDAGEVPARQGHLSGVRQATDLAGRRSYDPGRPSQDRTERLHRNRQASSRICGGHF